MTGVLHLDGVSNKQYIQIQQFVEQHSDLLGFNPTDATQQPAQPKQEPTYTQLKINWNTAEGLKSLCELLGILSAL